MPQESAAILSNGLALPQLLVHYKMMRPPSLIEKIRAKFGSMYSTQCGLNLKSRQLHQQAQQEPSPESPYTSQIPQTDTDRISMITHASSAQVDTEELAEQHNQSEKVTQDTKAEKTQENLLHDQRDISVINEAYSNIVPSQHIETHLKRNIAHFNAGKHYFMGEVVIWPYDNSLAESARLNSMDRIIENIRYHIFWSDGSLIQRGIKKHAGGSAAVRKDAADSVNNWKWVANRTPWDTTDSTKPELHAIQLAMQEAFIRIFINRASYGPQTISDQVIILTDSQSALKELKYAATEVRKPVSIHLHEYVNHIINLSEMLDDMGVHVTLRWVPGHAGDEGNERADMLAKWATNIDWGKPRPMDTERPIQHRPEFQVWRINTRPLPELKVTTMDAKRRIYSFPFTETAVQTSNAGLAAR